MSRVEEGNLFVRQFTRVALALSVVTSGFVLADQNINTDVDITDYLSNGETNTTIAEAIDGNGAGANVTVSSGVNITGAIVSGENFANSALPGTQATHTYRDGHDSVGTVIGLDVNDTILELTNLGNIGVRAETLASYTTDSGITYRPDQNNTILNAKGIVISNPMLSASNLGTIEATAILNNDTNNSEAHAVGVEIGGGAMGAFVNNGSITATAETHNALYDANGYAGDELVARIGGHTGRSGTLDTRDLGTKAHYTSQMQEDTHVGTDSKIFQDDDAKYNDRLLNDHDYGRVGNNAIDTNELLNAENYVRTDNGIGNNSHIHIENYTAADLGSPANLDNIISAEGVTVTGIMADGISNHNYISSLKIDAVVTGTIDALLVSPNDAVTVDPLTDTDGDGIPDLEDSDVDGDGVTDPGLYDDGAGKRREPTEAEVNATKDAGEAATIASLTNVGAAGNQGGATYGVPSANNGTLTDATDNNYSNQAAYDAEASYNAEIAALGPEPDPAAFTDVATGNAAKDAYAASIDAATADNNYTAVKDDIAKAYLLSPSAGGASEVNTTTETPTLTAAIGLPVEGEKTARIGNTVNNVAIAGAVNGVMVRAATGTNLSDEINATTGDLVASDGLNGNRNINANVTSASYSAYLGEEVDANGNSRIITLDTNRSSKSYLHLTNDLVGGFKNNLTVSAGLGGSAFTLVSEATALALHADHIDINQTVTRDADGNILRYEDIVSNPTSIVGVGTLENSSIATAMTGGLGGSGLEIQATAIGGMATPGTITGKELIISPTSITNVREIINYGNIIGGLGGHGVSGMATATGAILAGDINASKGTDATQQTGIVVRTHADATAGNFFSSGTIVQSLGLDALDMEATGSSTLALTGGTTDADVTIYTSSIGGVKKVYGKDGDNTKLTDGSFLNAGLVTSALSMHAVNMQVAGVSTIGTVGAIKDSDLNVTNYSFAGTEGSFGNVAWAGKINEETLTKEGLPIAQRGLISASLAMDAVHLTGSGLATLLPVGGLENSNTEVTNISQGGVGEHFLNYGIISSSLAMNGVNLSATGGAVLLTPSIVAGNTQVTNITRTGTGGDFINGASAIEVGALNEDNVTVHNPLYDYTNDSVSNPTLVKDHDGYYTVAANINENNTSDTNSSGEHENLLVENTVSTDIGTDVITTTTTANTIPTRQFNQLDQAVVHSYDKEALIVPSAITSSLALDAINFTALNAGTTIGTGTIMASTDERIDRGDDAADTADDTNKDTFNTRAVVGVTSIVDSSIGGDFINNGLISSSLALNAVNGASTSAGVLATGEIRASDVSQETYTRAGVQGNFYNEAVSREVGAATQFTVQEGNKEIGAFTYDRAITVPPLISSSLALNAITLESNAVNTLTVDTHAALYVHDPVGSGTNESRDEEVRDIEDFKNAAGVTRSNIKNSTVSIAGVGGDFSNTGLITSSLALNAIDGVTTGTNAILGTYEGSNVENSLVSIGGIQGDFDNDIQSLKTGSATLVYRDVYDIDENNNRVDPKYYDNEDAKEGERVKSQVVDRVVYDRMHLAPLISSSLALNAITMDAINVAHTNLAGSGVSEVEVVTNHTGYTTANENNVTLVENDHGVDHLVDIKDSDRIIKVTSEHVSSESIVVAGIGGKFTNRGLISASLALNGVTALGLNTLSTLGGSLIEGGNVDHSTLVVAGIGNDNNTTNREGFLNAADTYDIGAVHVEQSTVISHNNGEAHLLAADNGARVANDAYSDGNDTEARDRRLTLIDSEDVIFWDKEPVAIPGTMTSALALDVINVSATNLVSGVVTGDIKAVTGDVNVTTISAATGTDEIVAVVGHHVEGTARANVNYNSTVIAGINGGFTNQGIMSSSLALNVLQASVPVSLGSMTSNVEGSTVKQSTVTIAGVQDGDFRNEMQSYDAAGGEVYTELNGNKEEGTVAFNRTLNLPPVMSSALALDVADLKVLATVNTTAGTIEASAGVKYDGNNHTDWNLDKIYTAARTVSSEVNSSTTTIAGIEGDFYNTGIISTKLALNGIDAPVMASSNLFTSTVKGSDASSTSYTRAGIQGDFTNDIATLDIGDKNIIKRDVLDANGKALYVLSDQGYNPNNIYDDKNNQLIAVSADAGTRLSSNVAYTNIDDKAHEDENNYEFGIGKDGIVEDGVVYDQAPTIGTLMNNALALDVVNTTVLLATHTATHSAIEDEVKVVRMSNTTSNGTRNNEGIRSTADKEMIVDVTSDTVSNMTAIAGIGGKFTNRSAAGMTAALSLNVIDSWANGVTTASPTVHGGHTDINSLVIAGIGNGDNNESRGVENRADSYNTTVHVGNRSFVSTGDVEPVDGNRFHASDANDVIIARLDDVNYTDGNQSLALMESQEVVYWDNVIISGNMLTSLALDVFKLNAVNTANLGATEAFAVTNEVNVSGELQQVAGFHVTGSSVGAKITEDATVIAGIRGGFLNQGIITTALAGNVLDASSVVAVYPVPATNGVLASDVVGSDVTTTTRTIVGIQEGGFTNEIVSLDTAGSEVVTALNTDGTERPEVIFNRERTIAPVAGFMGTNLALDVVKLDIASTNTVNAPALASEYVLSSATTGSALDDAKSGMSNVSGTTVSIGGIDGDFYNSGWITSTLALNAITSSSFSANTVLNNDVIGANYEANGISYARINGDFVNDARLYDNDTTPTVNYYPVSDTNDTDSHVARSVTYDQDVVQGLISTTTSAGSTLRLIASGSQAVNIAEMGVMDVKVVDVSSEAMAFDADLNHTTVTERISSNIKVANRADSGVGGIFINAGLMTSVAAAEAIPAMVHLDALGLGSSVTVDTVVGGTLQANDTILNGTNLAATSDKTFGDLRSYNEYTNILPAGIDIKALNITTEGENRDTDVIGFLNDKRDFNTVLESDANHDGAKVATGTIGAALLPVPVSMIATGSSTTSVTSIAAADGRIYTTDTDANSKYGTATINHVENVNSVIQGDFVNLGSIAALTSPIASINMLATNGGASNDVHTIDGNETNGGLLLSNTESHVNSYIDGDFINTGTIISPLALLGINMSALGGTSEIKGTMDSKELTEYAGENGKVVASNLQSTHSGAKHFFNSGEVIHVLGPTVALVATGTADSTGFSFTDTNLTKAKNVIIDNQVISDASLLSLTNTGILTGGIKISATGEGLRATDTEDVNLASYENTFARVNASSGDIRNMAYTRQQMLWEVDKAFNTDGNSSTDDQLHATEERVTRNGGEYDLTTGERTATDGTYSTTTDLERLAYGVLDADQNTTAPILEQHQGLIDSAVASAISIEAIAKGDDNATLVTASTGHIVNGGTIASTLGFGIELTADGDADATGVTKNKGAIARATIGVIANQVTHDTFTITDNSVFREGVAKPAQGEVIHAVMTAEISGSLGGIKLDAVDAGDKDVSIATVEQIVNYRQVLNQGDLVIDSSGADADAIATADGAVKANGGTIDTRIANYGVKRITTDNVYNSVISGNGTGPSIIVGENAHVIDGIHNYGELVGKVEIGDAELHLYGLVQNADHNETFGARPETDEMGLTNNYFAVKSDVNNSAYVDAEDHVQVAGMITTTLPAKVTSAIIGSKIYFDNSHILDTADATYNADRIILPAGSIVNIDENTEFITEASNPFDVNLSEDIHNMMTNNSYLNVRAGITATVTGNYEQKGGYFVTNVDVASTPAGATTPHSGAGGTTFGQLDVSGNADLTGGILVMLDDLDTDLTPAAGAETRLVDVVKSANFTVGADRNMTHAGGNYDALTAQGAGDENAAKVVVQDNTRVFDFEAVAGTNAGDISLRIVEQDANAADINIDTTNVAISAIRSTARVIAARVDSHPQPQTFNFRGTPTRVVHFTSTEDAPIFVPNTEATVAQPVAVAPTGQTGQPTQPGEAGQPTQPTQPTQPDVQPNITVLSQGGQTGSNGSVVLNTTTAVNTTASVKPSLGDYEISKNQELRQLKNKNFNVWGKIFASSATQDGDDVASNTNAQNKTTSVQLGRAGYSSSTYGLVAGADKQYGEWFLGTAVALAKSTADTNSGATTSTETTMFQVTEYGSHEAGKGRVNFQGGFAYLTNNKDRTDGFVGDGLGSDGTVYNSDYNGYALNAAVEYEQGYALNSDTTLMPYVGLTGTYVNNDGYTETGGNNAQEVSSADSSALVVGVGTRATYKLSENSALLGNVGIGYDMIAERVDYEARTALNVNSETLHIEGAKPEELEYEVGVGYQFVTPKNTVIRANVDYRARDGYEDTTGSVKFYFPF